MTNNDIQNDFIFSFVYAQCQFRPRAIFFILFGFTYIKNQTNDSTVQYTVHYGGKNTKQTNLCLK